VNQYERQSVDDEELTALALAAGHGHPPSIDAFARATRQDVWRYLAHLTDAQTADDLTQETFLRALGSLPGFDARSTARTWLLSIARRTVVDRYRHAVARPRIAELRDWREAAEAQRRDSLPGFDEGIALVDLLTRLPRTHREAFVLTQVIGLPYAQAAHVLQCPVGTIRSRVARARSHLIRLLRQAEDDTGKPRPTAQYADFRRPGRLPLRPLAPDPLTA